MASRYWSICSDGILVEVGQKFWHSLRVEKGEVKVNRRGLPVGARCL